VPLPPSAGTSVHPAGHARLSPLLAGSLREVAGGGEIGSQANAGCAARSKSRSERLQPGGTTSAMRQGGPFFFARDGRAR